MEDAGEDLDRGGLPGAVRADVGHPLPGRHVEVEVAHRLDLAARLAATGLEDLRQPPRLDRHPTSVVDAAPRATEGPCTVRAGRAARLEGLDPCVGLGSLRPGRMDVAPRPTADEHADHAGRLGREHVVVEPVADVGDRRRRGGRARAAIRSKKRGDGFSTPHPAEEAMRSTGASKPRSTASARSGWLPATPDRRSRPRAPLAGTAGRRGRGRRR